MECEHTCRLFLEEAAAIDPRFKSLSWLTTDERDDVFERITVKAVVECTNGLSTSTNDPASLSKMISGAVPS
jgi:hypothetical protein